MSLEKSRLRMELAESMGRQLEKARDKTEREVYRHQGATTALKKVEQLINKHTKQVRDELVEARKDELSFDLDDLISVGKYIVDRMMKLSSDIHTMADSSSSAVIRLEGVKQGYDGSVKTVFKEFESEKNKLESLVTMIESGQVKKDGDELVFVGDPDDPGLPRPPGVHPGPPLKAVRNAEVEGRIDMKVPPRKVAKKKTASRSRKTADAKDA